MKPTNRSEIVIQASFVILIITAIGFSLVNFAEFDRIDVAKVMGVSFPGGTLGAITGMVVQGIELDASCGASTCIAYECRDDDGDGVPYAVLRISRISLIIVIITIAVFSGVEEVHVISPMRDQ